MIYRDCRAVVASTLDRVRTGWNGQEWTKNVDTPAKAAANWVRAIESMERNADRVHAIRYEDLIQRPAPMLENLAQYLGVEVSGFDRSIIRQGSLTKYKKSLSVADLGEIWDVAGPTMERLGYEREDSFRMFLPVPVKG